MPVKSSKFPNILLICIVIIYKSSFLAACGGHLTTASGIIQSPGYPDRVHGYRYCHWFIEAPKTQRIRLEFLDVDMSGPDCDQVVYVSINNLLICWKVMCYAY